MGFLRKIFLGNEFHWLTEEWRRLDRSHRDLNDDDFLRSFQPILKTFHARKRRLERCANATAKLYPSKAALPKRKILEIASGCDVFPAIMRSKGYEAIGLDAAPMIVRYCRIKNIPIICPDTWDMPVWTTEKFDIVALINYITGPLEKEWNKRMLERLCDNILYLVSNGADFLLFDLRYFEPIMKEFRRLGVSENIHHKRLSDNRTDFYLLTAPASRSEP